jgi:RND family efflux transporter MFP subunit
MLSSRSHLALCLAFCSTVQATSAEAAPQAESRAALTVKAEPVDRRQLRSTILATGTVTAWRELQIASEASGLAVTWVAVEEGQQVREGDLLVRLNDAMLRAQITQQEAAITEARANVTTAQLNFDRSKSLVGTKAISQQSFDEKANALDTSRAKLAAAEAALGQLNAQFAQTRIVAPAGGLISKRSVNIGQVVSIGAELLRIVQDNRLEVDALVPEADLLTLKPAQSVAVIGPSGERSEGKIRAVAPIVDTKTRLGTVHIALPAGTSLMPGMFARAEISSETVIALMVPQSAVVWRNGAANVFLVGQDNIVAQRQVRTGRHVEGGIEITGGLAGGEIVVSQGAGFLTGGDLVQVELRSASAREDAR